MWASLEIELTACPKALAVTRKKSIESVIFIVWSESYGDRSNPSTNVKAWNLRG
jgi:hypothetical protein